MISGNSDLEYDVVILGGDPPALQLAQRLCGEFPHILWIGEEPVSVTCPGNLNRLTGTARFKSAHELVCQTTQTEHSISSQYIVIATGVTNLKPRWFINHPQVLSSWDEATRPELPQRIAIANRDSVQLLLPDRQGSLNGSETRRTLETSIIGLEEEQSQIRVFLETGESTLVDLVVSQGTEQQGRTSFLNLQAAGLSADDRGCLWCNANYETWTEEIYAIGSVVGYPSPACDLREQIELVVHSMRQSQTNRLNPAMQFIAS